MLQTVQRLIQIALNSEKDFVYKIITIKGMSI